MDDRSGALRGQRSLAPSRRQYAGEGQVHALEASQGAACVQPGGRRSQGLYQLVGAFVAPAALAAKRAGAIVHGGPSAQTTVVVRGRPNVLQAAGRDAGRKLMEIKRLREKGHRISLLSEATFWRLVGSKGKA